MKRNFVCLICVIISLQFFTALYAQEKISNFIKQLESVTGDKPVVYLNDKHQIPLFIEGKLSQPSNSDKKEIAYEFLQQYSSLFQIQNAKQEFKIKRQFTDKLNKTHIHFQQKYNGLEVWGSELIIHIQQDGSIYCVNGRTEPRPSIPDEPVIDSLTALNILKNNFDQNYSIVELTLTFYTKNIFQKLAWKARVVNPPEQDWLIFIDAYSGKTLLNFNQTPFDGTVTCSGKGVNGDDKTFQGYQKGSTYEMIDITKSMYSAGISPEDETYGNIITKNSLTNSVVTSNSTVFSDPAAVDAHTYTSEFYDFVENNFDRTSWDGNGRSIISNVHYGSNYNNAFWSNYYEQLYYGDSDGKNFVSFAASKDIIAHEITHGITYSTSGLIYFDQPGALNESFSDIMGVAYDDDDWLIGEDHTIAEPKYTRNFINPNLGYVTFPLSFGAQPKHMSEYFYAPYDNGGIHYNSGIHNKAMYTLSEFIGREDAAKIFFRTFTTYLSANSHFIDARFAAIRSAKDLNLDTTAVKTAYDAVGIFPFTKDASEIYIYDPIVETDISIFATLPVMTAASAEEKFSLHVSPSVAPMHLMTIAFIYGAGQLNREVNIEIYEDQSGMPGEKLGGIEYTIPLNDAFAAIVDLSFLGIDVSNDFHVVLSSSTPGFKVAFIPDQNNNRSLLYNGNQWELLYGSIGIRAVARYQRDASLEVRWAKQKSNTTQAIRSFSMFSAETGWAVGTYGTLLFTYTGGLIWHAMEFEGGEDLLSIDFGDFYTGCIIGGVNIYYTTDGGLEWKTAENPSYNNMKAVQLVNANIGWTVGNWGTILKTTDGGATWLQQSTQTGNHFYALDFVDENTGWVVGANGAIYYTSNGGDTWVEQTSPVSNYFYGVDFIDHDLGWIVGGEGIILKTTDGGKNWIEQISPTDAGLRAVGVIDNETVYTVGFGGALIKTLDGNLWQVEPTGEVNNFYCIEFADYNTGWIGGELGTILNTRPQITDVNISEEKPLKWELQQNYPNPFNPNTTIKFSVPERSIVKVEVFNVLGQRIALLLDEIKEPGTHQVEWQTKGLASGIYIYRLHAKTDNGRKDSRMFKKMILLK